jgi:hypothetical protein
MNWRYRLADWISGYRLSQHRESANAWFRYSQAADVQAAEAQVVAYRLREALDRITAICTPGANATVRKMAAIAEEALK